MAEAELYVTDLEELLLAGLDVRRILQKFRSSLISGLIVCIDR